MGQRGWSLGVVLALAAIPGVSRAAPPTQLHRRAVIVGIDDYTPDAQHAPAAGRHRTMRAFRNLNGAVTDAVTMRDVLVSRLGFQASDIVLLTNANATRQAILDAIRIRLIAPTKKGDAVFFFFAGHGSQVRNSLSRERDKEDETIVPADAWTGVYDIRDKELAALFDQVIDKGGVLTAVFDSCHSGSIARGAGGTAPDDARWAPPDDRDVADPSNPPHPEDRGALVFSAAQADESAHEYADPAGGEHGLFSYAFETVLRTADPSEPAADLFRQVKARMRFLETQPQEPVLAGTPARRSAPLFGSGAPSAPRTTVAVIRVEPGGLVSLQGGDDIGLTAGTVLARVGGGAHPPTLCIEGKPELTRSHAKIVSGSPGAVHPGDLFAITAWAPPRAPVLRVFVPGVRADEAGIARLARRVRRLVARRQASWVTDPIATVPTDVLYFDGQGYALSHGTAKPIGLGKKLELARLSRALRKAHVGKGTKFYFEVPVPESMAHPLEFGPGSRVPAIAPGERGSATYQLAGRLASDGIAYSWLMPWRAHASGTTLPASTKWVAAGKAATEKLVDLAARLARIAAWLSLTAPGGHDSFPFRLHVFDLESNENVDAGPLVDGHAYGFALEPVRKNLAPSTIVPRFVYVFDVDSHGNMTLLFPTANAGGVENRFPPVGTTSLPARWKLGAGFRIVPPFGTDTYVMLSTREELPDPLVLQHGGVRGAPAKPPHDPLSILFTRLGRRSRGAQPVVPVTWSIARLPLKSVAATPDNHAKEDR